MTVAACEQGWQREFVLQEYPDGSRIIVIKQNDKAAMKRVSWWEKRDGVSWRVNWFWDIEEY